MRLFNFLFCLFGICLNGNTISKPIPQELNFYFSAHQDDWQLFMGTNAYNDVSNININSREISNTKTIFVYLTAGNLTANPNNELWGYNPCSSGNSIAYWKVREKGAVNSIIMLCNTINNGALRPIPTLQTINLSGTPGNLHTVRYMDYKNTRSYFLRISDYNNFYQGSQNILTVDNSTTYKGWCDLVATLKSLVTYEVQQNGNLTPWINIPDYNVTNNPDDHGSHINTSKAVIDATNSFCYPVALYVDYHTQNLSVNLNHLDIQKEAYLVGSYCFGLLEHFMGNECGEGIFEKWNARSYYRTSTTCLIPSFFCTSNSLQPNFEDFNVKNELPIDIKHSDVKDKYPNKVSILNIQGQLEKEITWHFHYKAELNSLPNGVYIIILYNKDGEIISKEKVVNVR